jgi:hypothetical protein
MPFVGSYGEAFEREFRELLDDFGIVTKDPSPPEVDDDRLPDSRLILEMESEVFEDPKFAAALLAFLFGWGLEFANETDRQATRLRKLELKGD